MQVVDASGNMFGYDSITVAGPDGKPKTISTAVKLVTLVRNTSGSTMTKGTVVYINGGSGNKPTIAKALATSDATSAQTYGVVQANIPNNKNGYVVVVGALEGVNTSAYAPGTQLYLSSTVAGEWTSTKQLAPNHLVYVGIVVRQHVNQGVVEVKIQNGYELDEIHDVQIVSPTNGQTLVYDSATSLWKNGSGGGGGGASPIDIQLFTSSGVWTKPAGAKQVEVYLFGAGGGGGSGRVGAAASARYSGGGASTGSVYINKLDASVFNNTENIWIGAGGTGGSAQTVANSNGNNGVTGGSSFVGGTGGAGSAKIIAPGGAPGQGGTGTSNGSGQAPGGAIYGVYGTGNYGSQTVNANGFSTTGTFTMRPLTPGVYGGGIDTANARYSGSTIVNRYMNLSNIYSILGGTSAGASGNNGILSFTDLHFVIMASGGSGGASGDVLGTVSGGIGGNGAICCGGGGGGAATNGASSGAGGIGGDGFCMLITYF